MTQDDYNKSLLALTLWREAGGEGYVGMQAVGNVIRNRVVNGNWSQVLSAKWQFSSLTAPGDPMLVKWPAPTDGSWQTAMEIAQDTYDGTLADITYGATHYFNPSVVLPSWAASMTKVASIGHHDFYK